MVYMITETCQTCFKSAGAPFRVYDVSGRVVEGCVDSFHDGHLIPISESNRWHWRPSAKAIRRSKANWLKQFKAR
jgi:hypothetical protein